MNSANAKYVLEPAEVPGPRLRVLQVGKFYPPYLGGIETHLRTLSVEIRDAVEVEVVVANVDRRTEEEWLDGIRVSRLGTKFNLAAAPICPELVQRLRSTPADIVHVHLPNPMAVLAYLVSGHPGRLVVSYHSDVVRQRTLERAFRPFLTRFLRRADAIVVATPHHVESSPVLRDFRDRCRVIPYGISLPDQEHRSSESVRLRKQHGPRLILAVGRLVYYKGFEYLIRAMRGVDARLLIVGEGPLREQLEQEVRASGVEDRVQLLGRVEDVTALYQAADVFVLPSVARSEAFGIVQIEAMACGTPVVNTRLDSGVPFVSLDQVSGLTVPPEDPAALASAINRLLDEPDLRAQLGRSARDRARAEFSKEVMARRTLELYHRVLAHPRGAAAPAAELVMTG